MLINILDYHHGIDRFYRENDYKGASLGLVTVDNINEYQALTKKNYWHNIDYTMFSKVKNKAAKEFTIENILKAMTEKKNDIGEITNL